MKKLKLAIVFSFLFVLIACNTEKKSDEIDKEETANVEHFIGEWTGAIEAPGQVLPIKFKVNQDQTTFSLLMQGIVDYPVQNIKVEENEITITVQIQQQLLSFTGELQDEEITGTFSQNGQKLPYTLYQHDVAEGEFLEIETSLGNLAGELKMPEEEEGPHPVMLIIPGSGPTDRNGNSAAGDNDSLKLVAEALAEKGIASVRYDKRGAAKNQKIPGNEEDLTFEQYVEDAEGWIDLLAKDERFSKIGIIGHSQGSLEGILAAKSDDIELLISLAGPGRSLDNILIEQLQEQLPENLLEESEAILKALKAGEMVDDISPELFSMFRPSVQPFLSSMIKIDPALAITELSKPILIINGENDLQVKAIDAEVLHAANIYSDLFILPKMNHVLKDAPDNRDGNMLTYTNPNLPLSDGLMDGIFDFLETNDFK